MAKFAFAQMADSEAFAEDVLVDDWEEPSAQAAQPHGNSTTLDVSFAEIQRVTSEIAALERSLQRKVRATTPSCLLALTGAITTDNRQDFISETG